MWISRQAAFSDVVLAPAGILLGTGVIGLLTLLPGWSGGLAATIVALVLATAVMIGWPTWLARQRGEASATPAPLDTGDIGRSAVLALPLVVAGILNAMDAGLPVTEAAFGRLAVVAPSIEGLLGLAVLVVTALGSFLVVVLVARRAGQAFRSPDMSVTAGVRTYGIGLAAAAAVLRLLYSIGYDQPVLAAVVIGLSLVTLVLLVDRQVPSGLTTTRAGILTPAIMVGILWVLREGFLFGGQLLPRLALGATAATIALCMGVLVQAGRTWATVLLPLAAAVWLANAVIPTFG